MRNTTKGIEVNENNLPCVCGRRSGSVKVPVPIPFTPQRCGCCLHSPDKQKRGNSEGEKGREAERRKRFYGTLRIHKESQLREDNIDDNEGVKMSKAGITN